MRASRPTAAEALSLHRAPGHRGVLMILALQTRYGRNRRRHREPDRSPCRDAARRLRTFGIGPPLGGHRIDDARAESGARS